MSDLYSSARWRRERLSFLAAYPVCVMCAPGIIESATVVDHIVPHRGDMGLFWDRGNWQPLCKKHHDREKQTFESTGRIRQVAGPDGWPQNAPGSEHLR